MYGNSIGVLSIKRSWRIGINELEGTTEPASPGDTGRM